MDSIEISEGLCQGYANCVDGAPDYFDIDDDGLVVVLKDEVSPEERPRVDTAARSCPVAALRLVPR